MNAPCPHCDHIHPSDAAVAVGRFSLRSAVYRASNWDGSPTRATRAEAVEDWCDHARGVAT